MTYLNGKKTVYCRYCGAKGHNRRTCGQITPERRAEEKSIYPRSCSWCGKSGHDVRHCEQKTADYQAWYQENIKTRQATLERINKIGFTPGALLVPAFEIDGKDYSKLPLETVPTKYMVMVDRIAWDNILSTEIPAPRHTSWRKRNGQKNRHITRNPVHVSALGKPSDDDEHDYYYCEQTWLDIEDGYYSWRGNYKMAIPSAPLMWEDLPEAFRNGTSGTDKLWSKKK